MKLAVCVKHAVDETELKLDADGRPLTDGAASRMSTFDKNAVEEGLRLKATHGGEVVAVTVGGPDARKSLKEALAMGADRAIHVIAGPKGIDALGTATLLADALKKEGLCDLVLCSEGSSDVYTALVPPMLGELLGVPYVGYARKIELREKSVGAERSLEDSIETVEASLPAVISVVSEINEPRYPTLIQIMQASKKQVVEIKPEQNFQSARSSIPRVISMSAKPANRKHVMLDGTPDEAAAKLVEALRKEGVI